MAIHPTALIDPRAELGDVEIGPFALVGPGVTLADGVVLEAHAVVVRDTTLGPRCRVGTQAVLGGDPQDATGEGTRLEVGADNVFREHVTIHRGAAARDGVTRIGDSNHFMTGAHVGHGCHIGSGCTLASSTTVSAEATVGDGAALGSLVGIHPQVRIGRLSLVGLGAMCAQDVPPFTLAQGDRARLFGLNVTGLRQAGLADTVSSALKTAWRTLWSGLPLRAAIARVREEQEAVDEVEELLRFLEESRRGICRAAHR